jgi:hypothetical protein
MRGAPPLALTAEFPATTVHFAPTATTLFRRVADATEVDELAERLRSLGIAPLEVRASARGYEFRIQGRLGRSILRYLRWGSRLEPERTVVRVAAAPRELRMILEQLAESGIQIDRCVRHPAD